MVRLCSFSKKVSFHYDQRFKILASSNKLHPDLSEQTKKQSKEVGGIKTRKLRNLGCSQYEKHRARKITFIS